MEEIEVLEISGAQYRAARDMIENNKTMYLYTCLSCSIYFRDNCVLYLRKDTGMYVLDRAALGKFILRLSKPFDGFFPSGRGLWGGYGWKAEEVEDFVQLLYGHPLAPRGGLTLCESSGEGYLTIAYEGGLEVCGV